VVAANVKRAFDDPECEIVSRLSDRAVGLQGPGCGLQPTCVAAHSRRPCGVGDAIIAHHTAIDELGLLVSLPRLEIRIYLTDVICVGGRGPSQNALLPVKLTPPMACVRIQPIDATDWLNRSAGVS
jgi:hypothetical protein